MQVPGPQNQSETRTDQAFLNGSEDGLPVTIMGELRLPLRGDERLPAIVLLHGSGGATNHLDGWVEELNAMGVATFLVDSFTGRGIASTVNDQGRLGRLAMIGDAYRALELLATHRRIDGGRIALMGFSRGGQAALYASLMAEAQAVRNCRLEERPDGRIHNRDTGQPFGYDDPCVERGATVAYDAQAHRQAHQAVEDLVAAVLTPE